MFTDIDFRNVGPGSGSQGRGAARSRRQGRRARRRRDHRRPSACASRRPTARASRSTIPSSIRSGQTAARLEHAGAHPHRRPAGVLRADRLPERALAGAGALSATAAIRPGEFPRFEELMAERNRMFTKHPKTTFIAAHFAWHANDLARMGKLFDDDPNVYTEVGAILYDLGRQPRAAHDFFIKYQDRILFGKDSFQPDEFPYYWRVFETNDEYFDYYRDYHAFWKLYGMGLPDEVLKKLYYKNALASCVPGLPQDGWPAVNGCVVSRHRRRRLHRLPSGRRTARARPRRARRRQPDHRQAAQPRGRTAAARRPAPRAAGLHGRRPRRSRRGDARRGRHRLRAPPGGHALGAALGGRPDVGRTAPTSTATLNVLVAARDAGVKRLVFAGSSSVYGDAADPAQARGHAGAAALALCAAEAGRRTVLARCSRRSTASRRSPIRYFNVFGPRQDPGSPYSGVISLFVRAALDGTAPTIYGDGGQTRDFTYVANVVDGVLRAADGARGGGRGHQRRHRRPHLAQPALGRGPAAARDSAGRQLRPGPCRRREGLAGGDRQGRASARLPALGVVRRGPAPHGGVGGRTAVAGLTAGRPPAARGCRAWRLRPRCLRGRAPAPCACRRRRWRWRVGRRVPAPTRRPDRPAPACRCR